MVAISPGESIMLFAEAFVAVFSGKVYHISRDVQLFRAILYGRDLRPRGTHESGLHNKRNQKRNRQTESRIAGAQWHRAKAGRGTAEDLSRGPRKDRSGTEKTVEGGSSREEEID